ncbi:hypothetical protein BH10CYA1_BH10CYA1_09410 [soil metagenome]
MTQGSEGGKTSPKGNKEGKNAAGEKPQVARTKLDINMDDLIDPLHGPASDSFPLSSEQPGESKVAKTMLESDGPTLQQIKELSESGVKSLSPEEFKALRKELAQTLPESATLKNRAQVEHSIQAEAAEAQKRKLDTEKTKQEKKSVQVSPVKKELAKLATTIPESETLKNKLEADTSKQADHQDVSALKKLATTIPESESSENQGKSGGEDESVSLKELAKTIPDPPMQERKAVAKRIERIRSYQKTVQVKSVKFSKTMTQANLENLDSVRESSQWKSPADSSTNKKKPPVREQFVAKTQLDHDILFQAVSESKLKEESRVAAFLVEKSKEAPKPPPVAVKAEKQSSACPFKWEETDSKEKYRYCTKCQAAIYNFDGMELPEAEALIFNRENRDKFTLYSRADGKFMTVDCPLQKKRQRDLIMGIIVAVALLIGAVGLLMMMPQQQPGGPSNSSPEGSTAGSSGGSTSSSDVVTFSSTAKERPSSRNKSAAGSSSAGSGGYQTFQLPSSSQKAPQAPDPDEDGGFWKF